MGLLEISQVAPGTAAFRDSGEAATKVGWGWGWATNLVGWDAMGKMKHPKN